MFYNIQSEQRLKKSIPEERRETISSDILTLFTKTTKFQIWRIHIQARSRRFLHTLDDRRVVDEEWMMMNWLEWRDNEVKTRNQSRKEFWEESQTWWYWRMRKIKSWVLNSTSISWWRWNESRLDFKLTWKRSRNMNEDERWASWESRNLNSESLENRKIRKFITSNLIEHSNRKEKRRELRNRRRIAVGKGDWSVDWRLISRREKREKRNRREITEEVRLEELEIDPS